MRATIWVTTVVVCLGAVAVLPALMGRDVAPATGDHKIEVCHVPPGNPGNAHTVEVDLHAWQNGHSPHNAHNLDYEGPCQSTPTTSPPTSTGEPSIDTTVTDTTVSSGGR